MGGCARAFHLDFVRATHKVPALSSTTATITSPLTSLAQFASVLNVTDTVGASGTHTTMVAALDVALGALVAEVANTELLARLAVAIARLHGAILTVVAGVTHTNVLNLVPVVAALPLVTLFAKPARVAHTHAAVRVLDTIAAALATARCFPLWGRQRTCNTASVGHLFGGFDA